MEIGLILVALFLLILVGAFWFTRGDGKALPPAAPPGDDSLHPRRKDR